jgi:putative tricarboxylic transport membrane protein
VILIQKPRDVVSGLIVMAIGTGFLLFGSELNIGSLIRMGPGYFPTILSIVMIALGAVIAAVALRGPSQEGSVGLLPWRGIILIVGATIFFGTALKGLGLGPAVLVVVLATAWASRYASLRASLPLSIGLAVFCTLLFIRLLGLPLPLLGPWFSAGYWSPPASEAPSAPAPPPASQ